LAVKAKSKIALRGDFFVPPQKKIQQFSFFNEKRIFLKNRLSGRIK